MADLIHQFRDPVAVRDRVYVVQAWAGQQEDGRWEGWLEFVDSDGRRRRTPRETVQSNRDALAYWASGLEPVYLEGALQRALTRGSDVSAA